ncbi:hybrid sensor histidine kinase/response regulator [Anaeromyxobacter paludicola]|nr:ATP-binding protein [Anaeromyxobacter paludicola]
MRWRQGEHEGGLLSESPAALREALVATQEALSQAEAGLRDARRQRAEWMALLGHELRNPLAPLRNCVQLLLRAHHDPEKLGRATAIMERQLGHLTQLVDDLLDASRITRGKIALRRERLDLCGVVRGAAEDHRALVHEAGLSLRLELPDGPVLADADGARLAQVVGSLVENAVKFTDAGGYVQLSLTASGGQAVLSVSDSGIGMEPGTEERMFEPFAQADVSLARSRGGLGLGLALVKGLVELHGGTVKARSDGPGLGTAVRVTLPCRARAERLPRQAGPAVAAVPRQRRVLLVDDNVDGVETLAELLRLEGHEVEVAYDGQAGLEAAHRFHPDVTFCDIGMPGDLDGYAVAARLRHDAALKQLYLVALTGYASPEDRDRARDAGFDLHLAKPPELSQLREVIARAPEA